jgi:hypothetical protein
MTTQMILRVDKRLKDKVDRLAKSEGKNTSVLVRELLATYVTDHDPAAYIDDLWGRIGNRLKRSGVTPATLSRAIRDTRAEQA